MRIKISTGKRVAMVTAAGAVIALTACGGQPGNGGGNGVAGAGTGNVASLPGSGGQSSPGTQGTSAGQGGPAGLTGVTVPDNAPPAVFNRVYNAWALCMQAHGDHDVYRKQDSAGSFLMANAAGHPAAAKACQSLQPHPPWQEIPQYNPNYQRDFARWINCLNARGVPVKAVSGGWTYNGTSSLSAAQQTKVRVECEMRAFNEK